MRWRVPRRRVEDARCIYEHVRAHLPSEGPGLSGDGDWLPDEPEFAGHMRWVPGALDGIGVHHMSTHEAGTAVDEVYHAVRAAVARGGSARAYRRLYEVLRRRPALSVVDPLVERLASAPLPAQPLRDLAERLATTSAHREPVKYGIALLGVAGGPDDRDVLRVLGRHEEFTLFAAVALQNTGATDEELWQLARLVDGWGRIHLVERLRDTTDPRIRDWILRQGFRNTVMDEYLAYIAATTGGLLPALRQPRPDDEVLTAACDIVSALLAGGPAEDIDDYGDGAQAVWLLVEQLSDRAERLDHFLVVRGIEDFLGEETDAWPARESRGWTPKLRVALAAACAEITGRTMWGPLAVAGLDSDDELVVHKADRVAKALGIDRFPAHWRRLRRLGSDATAGDWYDVMSTVTDDAVAAVLDLAERSLPLADIASGPADALGLGPEYRAHQALDFVVQELGRFPGVGWPLVAAALRSPVVRNRNMAVNTLRVWGRSAWPTGVRAALRRARDDEPREDVRQRIDQLLADVPVDRTREGT